MGGLTLAASAVRFPLQPLLDVLGVRAGRHGGQQPGQPNEGLAAAAMALGVSHRTVQRLWSQGLDEWQADRYAVAAGWMPWDIWPEWVAAAPSAEALMRRRCRCRASERRPLPPLGMQCDRCGGRIVVSASAGREEGSVA